MSAPDPDAAASIKILASRGPSIHDGKSHCAELAWKTGIVSLGYKLLIDGQRVAQGSVTPRNFFAQLVPAAIVLAFAVLFAHFNQ